MLERPWIDQAWRRSPSTDAAKLANDGISALGIVVIVRLEGALWVRDVHVGLLDKVVGRESGRSSSSAVGAESVSQSPPRSLVRFMVPVADERLRRQL